MGVVRAARFDHVDSVRQRRFEFLTKILIDSRRCPIDWLCNDTAQRYGRFVLTPAIAGFTLFAAFEESRFAVRECSPHNLPSLRR